MSVGYHISSGKNKILDSAERAYKNGATIVQFFVNSAAIQDDMGVYDELRKFLTKNKMKSVVHITYTINCAQVWDAYSWWIKEFIDQINIADYIGSFACVVHLGKQVDLTFEEAMNNMYTSLLHVHQSTKNTNVKLLLETSTGQGTEMGYRLDDLAYIYRKFSKHKNETVANRFGICLDTCHIFSAGYDLKSEESRLIFFDNFNELIGLNNIHLIHLNDSRVPCGAKVDRHDNIGKGYIGKDAITILIKIFEKYNFPMVLETPYWNIIDDLKYTLSVLSKR